MRRLNELGHVVVTNIMIYDRPTNENNNREVSSTLELRMSGFKGVKTGQICSIFLCRQDKKNCRSLQGGKGKTAKGTSTRRMTHESWRHPSKKNCQLSCPSRSLS
jgi:hypothetical protein